MTPDLGIEPEPHWWEASALPTAPSLHPNQNVLICKATNKFASFFLVDNRCQTAIFTSLSKWIKHPTCFQLKQAKFCCCGASVASEQQHKQDLRRTYKRECEFTTFYHNALHLITTFYHNALHLTRVHCATYYQSSSRDEQYEDVTPLSRS